ncbi:HD domain-containing protein [Curvibacter sp. CHRR-16]|uniref:HD-GYP domain-containing protein n=1 Tax=Curvibacter sp. CHRR-16 TaxID=2835872 RepID=UPI001BD9A74D|nr:HD domain-containing phosphohydrolase [Curvibacter sp. CHRR-16]MBT0570256.1 HD domain-containing protein [Curvibacter sp. CHRR-16]
MSNLNPTSSTEETSLYQVASFAMATLAELRESDTESHILRIRAYIRLLAEQMALSPAYAATLTPEYIDYLERCAHIYDMGNIGIPDKILLKPGRLTAEEVAIMRTHTVLGHEALGRAKSSLKHSSPWLDLAMEVALSHHEKWDGSGYPQGLQAERIPLAARIVALADVFDALITSKVYKQGMGVEQACQTILEQSGKHFAPDVVQAFVAVQAQFRAVAQRLADTDADMQKRIEYLANAIAETAVF